MRTPKLSVARVALLSKAPDSTPTLKVRRSTNTISFGSTRMPTGSFTPEERTILEGFQREKVQFVASADFQSWSRIWSLGEQCNAGNAQLWRSHRCRAFLRKKFDGGSIFHCNSLIGEDVETESPWSTLPPRSARTISYTQEMQRCSRDFKLDFDFCKQTPSSFEIWQHFFQICNEV